MSLLSKTTTLHRSARASHFLMHFSPSLHDDHNAKFPSNYIFSNFWCFFFPDGLPFPAYVRRFVSFCLFVCVRMFSFNIPCRTCVFFPGKRPVTVSVCFCGVAILDFETKQGKIGQLQNVISKVGIRCSPPPLPLPFLPPGTCVWPQSKRILVLVPPLPQATLNTNAPGTLLFT